MLCKAEYFWKGRVMNIITDDHIDESEIALLVDGKISAEGKTVLMNRILKSPHALRHLEDLVYQKILLREWWKARM